MSYQKTRPYSWVEARALRFNPVDSSTTGPTTGPTTGTGERIGVPIVNPTNEQAEQARKQTESFIKDFDIPDMLETFDPSNSSNIITSEDMSLIHI